MDVGFYENEVFYSAFCYTYDVSLHSVETRKVAVGSVRYINENLFYCYVSSWDGKGIWPFCSYRCGWKLVNRSETIVKEFKGRLCR